MSDLISRQAILDELENYSCLDKKDITTIIKAMPSVENKGEWQHDGNRWKNRFICSVCGYKLFDEPTNYCPNCGAKMER